MYENGYPLRYFNNDATLQKEKRKMDLQDLKQSLNDER